MIIENHSFGPLLSKMTVEKNDLEKVIHLFKDSSECFKNNLVGHFRTEFRVDEKSYQNILYKYIECYRKNCENYYSTRIANLKVTSAWVNFMKKGDFNPHHVHFGCDFSSVLIIKTPDQLKKEAEDYYKNSSSIDRTNGPGSLQFCYGESLDNNLVFRSYEPKEGDFYIFPNWLFHSVNPFKSDGDRISVAANIKKGEFNDQTV
tara:strand:+ start:5886 stop:6497 length:612 start_codon:yes stop_codon:yes gene_type:complete